MYPWIDVRSGLSLPQLSMVAPACSMLRIFDTACTHTSDCTRRFLVNSRELESFLSPAVGISSIVDLVKVARSN